jgi:hypothetical protein
VALGQFPRQTGSLQVSSSSDTCTPPAAVDASCYLHADVVCAYHVSPVIILLQVYELEGTDAALMHSAEHGTGFKCGTLGASSSSDQHLATGSFDGLLQVGPGGGLYTTQEHVPQTVPADRALTQARRGCLIHCMYAGLQLAPGKSSTLQASAWLQSGSGACSHSSSSSSSSSVGVLHGHWCCRWVGTMPQAPLAECLIFPLK